MIKVIKKLDELRQIKQAWNQLASRFGTPLLQYDWFFSCAESFYDESDLRVILVYENGDIIAIAPMVIVTRSFAPWLELIGVSILYEPSGLIYRDVSALKKLIKGMVCLGFPIDLQRISVESPIYSAARSEKIKSFFTVKHPSASSLYVNTNVDKEIFQKSLSKRRRAMFRKKHRRAEELGQVSTEIISPTPAEFESYLTEAERIEAASWKGDNSSALRDNLPLRRFFHSYARRASEKNILRIVFFKIANKAVAMHIGVEYANSLWFLKIGYDREWSNFSPGIQLVNEIINFALSNNIKAYEFLGSEEQWQRVWPVHSHKYCSILIFPFGYNGIIGLFGTIATVLKNRLTRFIYGNEKDLKSLN